MIFIEHSSTFLDARGGSRVRFLMVSLEFIIHIIPGVDTSSNRNEYQEYLLVRESKGGRCLGLTILPPPPFMCRLF